MVPTDLANNWLPEIGPLAALPAPFWAQLAARLDAIGLDESVLRRFDFIGPDLGDAFRLPLQQWSARAEGTLPALAVAFLRLQEPVSWAELQQLFGGTLAKEMRAAGLAFESASNQFAFALRLGSLGGVRILADRHLLHPDAVMGSSAATSRIFTAAAIDSVPLPAEASLLDLGCGGGALALALRTLATRVTGCDISSRAVSLARINAMLNGLSNGDSPEFREGDLYAPFENNRFTRIVCQPPFIPESGTAATFASGGPLGDAITLRVLHGLADHLTPNGRAVLCVEWAGGDAHPWRQRVLDALAHHPMHGIHCELFRTPMEDYCTLLAPYLHPPASPGYGPFLKQMLDHYKRQGITSIDLVLHFLEPAPDLVARHAVRQVPLGSLDHVTAGYADAALAALRLAHAPDEALASTPLRSPHGFRVLSPADPQADAVDVEFAPEALLPNGQLPAIAASVLALAADGLDASEILAALPGSAEANQTLLRQLLAQGLLFPV
jgi:methylase of polypeptide subunit release factors